MNPAVTLDPPPSTVVSAGEGLAHFLRLRGCDVIERFGVRWHRVGGGLYMSFPYHIRLDLDADEVAGVLRSSHLVGFRYPSLRRRGLRSGVYVCNTADYELNSIDSKVRRAMKRGLAECEVRALTADEMLGPGLALNRETLTRQGRFDPELGDATRWKRFVEAAERTPAIQVYGSFVEGDLAAMAVTCAEDGWLSVLYRMSTYSRPEFHASHILDYRIVHDFAKAQGIPFCSFGLVPLIENPGLHCYKVRMGLRLEPQYSVIQLHPAVEPLLANRSAVLLAGAGARFSGRVEALERSKSVLQGALLSRDTSPAPPLSGAKGDDSPCPFSTQTDFSRLSRPYPVFMLFRMIWLLRTEGPVTTVRRAFSFLRRRFVKAAKAPRAVAPPEDANPLQPGELVEVKSIGEIRKTLDADDRCRGLSFLPEMEQYCGKRFTVFKRVDRIFLEESRQQRKLRQTVLLDRVYCTGKGIGCDRSCFLFWRDSWLKRVEPRNGNNGNPTA